ncbi:PspC domain-containing protein [Treponema phagedenis]|uniref:PspC domain protein n=1 Tax=Treponema phagedenis TaxID=162 RepID=A0A0B7GUS5_TREPH|nr:PspC domain-containing protein [Treponema phagedenis]EFW38377.1 PspC domain protein [Treponema phagedenis F0421]NVP25556.1 PspC domain-containing protein [Treponema phagedenis]QEJ94096.1 PspC domain-containing protein [Treponema phagedenis]QEJ97419.1 PspC domain-containing protein [Treponema phagedenis]QEK01893.1 PspC domain-containing protein [Treponema phagedenis]
MATKKLYRSNDDKKLFGVCGGIAEYFDIDSTIVRLGWVLLTFLSCGTGLVLYIIAAAIMPIQKDEPIHYEYTHKYEPHNDDQA